MVNKVKSYFVESSHKGFKTQKEKAWPNILRNLIPCMTGVCFDRFHNIY